MEKLIILGSGPAGLTAAIYSARAELSPLCIAGYQAGGQLMITTDVENYPGFPEGISGPELMERFRKQAERFGTKFIDKDASEVDFSKRPFRVRVEDKDYFAQAVIIATGAEAKWLGLENEKRLQNRGVSACATCDGAFFKGQVLCVVGGGDTAMEEAIFLTRYAQHVYVIHRRDKLRASKIMQQKAKNNPKISFIWDTEVVDVLGEEKVEGVRLRNKKTGEEKDFPCGGLFIAIGHSPSVELFRGQLQLQPNGYIQVFERTRTSVEGVFVAGDVHDFHYRQAITAAGFGCMAALDAEKYLESLSL